MEKDSVTKIEKALVKMYRRQEEFAVDSEWTMRVMEAVRSQGQAFRTDDERPADAQRFVWRFATVVCMLALVLSVFAFGIKVGLEQLSLYFFIDEPLALLTTSLFVL